jgi:hypothetical protein
MWEEDEDVTLSTWQGIAWYWIASCMKWIVSERACVCVVRH